MEIKTERLILKPLGIEYLNSTFKYSSDFDTTKYMMYLPSKSIEETADFLEKSEKEWTKESPEFYEFAILFNNKHIGAISLYLNENKTICEFGWIIDKDYWMQGFAFEAAKALLNFVYNNLNIRHFIAHCDSENIASYKVMEKLRMKRTAINTGRKNRSSDESRIEYQYELII